MSSKRHFDPATVYDDSPFPGRRLISTAVVLWLIGLGLSTYANYADPVPTWIEPTQIALLVVSAPLYFIGFWLAVVGKGYVKVLFLISLVPPIGLLILFFLPPLHKPVHEAPVIDLD